jgi:predicted enzyme related to lactoylglutathione lyase
MARIMERIAGKSSTTRIRVSFNDQSFIKSIGYYRLQYKTHTFIIHYRRTLENSLRNSDTYVRCYKGIGNIDAMSKTPLVSHVEWCCRDLQRAAAFFNRLFGWEFQRFSEHYLLHTPPSGVAVGLMEKSTFTPGDGCLVFVQVDRIEPTLEHAVALQGEVAVCKTEIPGYGWYAQLKDPDGNIVGLFETIK